MRRLNGPVVFVVALVLSASVFAAAFSTEALVRWFKAGLYVGSGAVASANNKLTRSQASGSITYNCGDTDAGLCTLSAAQTVTGALVADTCTIGPNDTAGALNGVWQCHVSATDAVKIKFCNPTGASIDPASGAFRVRTFSNQ